MTSICVTRAGPSPKPTRPIIKERDDFFHSLAVYGAAAAAQFVAAALVDRDLTGPADPVAATLRPTVQKGGRSAPRQRELIHQLRHPRRSHYVCEVRGGLERNGSDYGHESRRDGSAAGLSN